MRTPSARGWLVAMVVLSGILGLRIAEPGAQTGKRGRTLESVLPPGTKPAVADRAIQPAVGATPVAADEGRRAQIRDLDAKIKSLRDDFKAQADPLQTQLKALREKLEADLKPLQDQRKMLVEQGESPGLIALDQDEASQLASLADQEKAEIEKVRQRYEDQKKQLQADFQKRRQELAHK